MVKRGENFFWFKNLLLLEKSVKFSEKVQVFSFLWDFFNEKRLKNAQKYFIKNLTVENF